VVSALLKLCIKAIEAKESDDPGLIVSPIVNICNILEISIPLLLIDKAELLDQLRALMEKPQTYAIKEFWEHSYSGIRLGVILFVQNIGKNF
jgi:hypothetical protein